MDVQSGESEEEKVMGEEIHCRWVGNGRTSTRMGLNKKVLSFLSRAGVLVGLVVWMSTGRRFQAAGPATLNAR